MKRSKVTPTTISESEARATLLAMADAAEKRAATPPPLTIYRGDFERIVEADLHTAGRVGVKARVWLYLPIGGGITVRHCVESPGYWDILPRDASTLEIFSDECDVLRAMLTALGVQVTS